MPDKLIPGKKKTPVYYAVSSKKSPAKHSNIDGKKHPVNAETGKPEASHQPTYAAHGMKHPTNKKSSAFPFKLSGFSYPGKAPKKRAPTKFWGALAAGAVGGGLGLLGGYMGWGRDRGRKGRGRGWGGMGAYQKDAPYNRGWWSATDPKYSRNKAQWGGQNYSSAGYKDQPYELKTHTG